MHYWICSTGVLVYALNSLKLYISFIYMKKRKKPCPFYISKLKIKTQRH